MIPITEADIRQSFANDLAELVDLEPEPVKVAVVTDRALFFTAVIVVPVAVIAASATFAWEKTVALLPSVSTIFTVMIRAAAGTT